jgi:threonine dehydrogenase-like Zn-dependent dehydrogenase
MRALTLDRGRLQMVEAPVADRPGECLIRVTMAGICGTDLELVKGYADFSGIPGHEFVGIVEAAGRPEDGTWIGRRVVGDINIGCGACPACRNGVKEHCESRQVLGIRGRDGAFAEYLSLPSGNLHAVPDAVTDLAAVFVEPIAAACRILEQVSLGPATRVAVMGDGRMGLLIAQVLASVGASVVLLGKHDDRLALARRLGIEAKRSPESVPGPRGRFDIVVEATGAADGLGRALTFVRPRGTIVLKSTVHGMPAMSTWPIVVDEITVVGSRCGPFGPALDLLARGAVTAAPLVTCLTGLDDFERAFREAKTGLKAVFAIS